MIFLRNIYFLFLILTTISCKETAVEYIYSKNGYVQLTKNKVEIGEKITAHFINMDSVYVYSVTLKQKQVTYSQKNDSTVTLIVPFTNVGNDVGNFVFYCRMETDNYPDTVLVSNQINYKYEDGNKIKWNLNEKLEEIDSWAEDNFEQKQKWTMQQNMDTIKFVRSIVCHDECGETETLVFLNKGDDTLPVFLYALYDRHEMNVKPIHEKMTWGKIIINDWNSSTSYSGTFTTSNYSWVFWCKK